MSCKREHFENIERECKTKHGDTINEAMFEDLLTRVREYAQQRRLEETLRKTRGDPMDIGLLNQTGGWYNQEDWTTEEWDQPENPWWDYVNALNKGQGQRANQR